MSRSWGKRLFHSRNILASLPLAFALFSTPGEWESAELIWTTAIALCVAGIAIRAWARCHHNKTLRAIRTLIRTGPYAYIRNPLYVGSILIIAGATSASRLVWLVPVSLLWSFAVYAAVAAHEEGRMAARHGADYERYRAEVPAWIPALRAPSNAGSPSPFGSSIAIQAKKLLWLSPFILKELYLLKILAR